MHLIQSKIRRTILSLLFSAGMFFCLISSRRFLSRALEYDADHRALKVVNKNFAIKAFKESLSYQKSVNKTCNVLQYLIGKIKYFVGLNSHPRITDRLSRLF